MQKTHSIRLRVNSNQLAAIKEKSNRLGISQTALLLNSALQPNFSTHTTYLQCYNRVSQLTQELNRIHRQLQDITVMMGDNCDPTVGVERELLRENQKLVQEAIAFTKELIQPLINDLVRTRNDT